MSRACSTSVKILSFLNIALAVDCGVLLAPLNGSLHGSLTTFPNLVEFSCDEGFLLEGSYERRCQANTTWSGQTTFCRGAFSY